jgi:hypothetical protein
MRDEKHMMRTERFAAARDAIEEVLLHLQGLAPSNRTDLLHAASGSQQREYSWGVRHTAPSRRVRRLGLAGLRCRSARSYATLDRSRDGGTYGLIAALPEKHPVARAERRIKNFG